MSGSTNSIVQKVWLFCDTLRDDGLGYGDYLEQLTYLLFLKMANENKSEYNLPKICDWKRLVIQEKGNLLEQYETILKTLAQSGGMLTKIFAGAQNKINDSAKLKKLIKLIDDEEWTSKEIDVKGEIYESLLQKNAESSGAGQYFTPRSVISAMVSCIQPNANDFISDPSCGTGGFFLGVLNYFKDNNIKFSKHIKYHMFKGWEIEKSTARLCLMNLFLHGVGDLIDTPDIEVIDSLKRDKGFVDVSEKVDVVLANPPFGISSSDIPSIDLKQSKKEGYFLRKDFWVSTSNKQLAFLQHIVSMLKENGRAAVVLPDNILFEGGASEIVRKKMLETNDLHTILRLPTGIFYAHGVKANVIFFDSRPTSIEPCTKEVWYYDFRTNIHHTLKKNPLRYEDLKDFITCYNPQNRHNRKETFQAETNPQGRWRKFSYEEITARDKTSLDITWVKDTSLADFDNLPDPDVIASEIIEDLEAGLESFRLILTNLEED